MIISRIGAATAVVAGVFFASLPSFGQSVVPRPATVSTPWPQQLLTPRQQSLREADQSGYWTKVCYQQWKLYGRRNGACQAPFEPTSNGRLLAALPGESLSAAARAAASAATSMQIDARTFMAATIANSNLTSGNMLCVGTGTGYDPSCLTSYYTGEVVIPNANGIIDYIGISKKTINIGDGLVNEIGVIRNYPADGGDPLRCFTFAKNPSVPCSAPPNGNVFGPPYIMQHVPVISWAIVAATENDPNPTASDAWPTRGIPGALVTTPTSSDGFAPANYLNYTVNNFGSNCSQSFHFNTYSLGTVAYVTGVPFGGTVGTRDALVLDGFSYANPSTLERYYYVAGLGRVRENNAQKVSGQSSYGSKGQNLDRNQEKAVSSTVIYANGNHGGCPQGSAITLQ